MASAGGEFDFAVHMNMYDHSFAARYLRDGVEWRGTRLKRLEPELHDEAAKYDIYYMEVYDVDGLLEMCRQIPQCRVVAKVDACYNVVGAPLYVSAGMLGGRVHNPGEKVRLPHNLMTRPASFVPRCAEAKPAVQGLHFMPR